MKFVRIYGPLLRLTLIASALTLLCQAEGFAQEKPNAPPPTKAQPKQNAATEEQVTEQLDLRKAIDDAANDRAALVKNLEAFLKKYPESQQRPQIFRALVEASLQLRDFPRAMDYSERMVSLNPEDVSNMALTIQLLERYGDVPGYRRAVFYCSRVLDYLDHATMNDKSPRVSPEDWAAARRRDKSSILLARGRLYVKLGDTANAQKDFAASYALAPSARAAEHLGEIAELKKDFNEAILQYSRAFSLTDGANGSPSRAELRKKIGNVWRLAHGSEDGLGDYLLHNFDDTIAATAPAHATRNPDAKDPYEFVLRKVGDGSAVHLASAKGKILVLNFWATWCGPCHELEPHFDRIASSYAQRSDVLFYALNCDDDESLVAPYLADVKSNTPTLFADGLDRLLGVVSFPTTLILDRNGKIAFREDGFDPDGFDKSLRDAVERVAQAPNNSGPTAAATP
jgi:thiol-disulfide isomerase/thioredoxin